MKIFNELKEAEWMIKNGFRNGFNSFSIGIIARYFRYLNLEEKEIIEKVFDFCKKYSIYNEILDDPIIIRQINKSKKYKLRIPIDINITENELNKIKELHNYRYEKFLFTMLVLGKYEKNTNVSDKEITNENYYVNQKKPTIYRLSHTSKKKNENIIYELGQKELIENVTNITKYKNSDNTYLIKFTNINDNSLIKIIVTDIENIINFYPPYCEQCGNSLEKKSKMHCLCDKCYKEKRLKDSILKTKKYKNKTKGYQSE
jgi:hypothetical protein